MRITQKGTTLEGPGKPLNLSAEARILKPRRFRVLGLGFRVQGLGFRV